MKAILQINPNLTNPVSHLSGYKPTTEYWPLCLRMANAMLRSIGEANPSKKQAMEGANVLIELEIFSEKTQHTAVEWAEFVMAINHVLWLLDDAPDEAEGVNMLMEILHDLYYIWRDKALDTLKGDDLSTYLRITD